MQARLEIRRFPSMLVALIVAAVAALVIGAALGFAVKPATFVSGPTRVVVVSTGTTSSNPSADSCVFVNHHKYC
jgi:hypothetical protein